MLAQVTDLTLGEAARAIGVSVDTLRRWDRAGKVETVRDERNQRRVPRREVERLTSRPARHSTGAGLSARNRFPGVVTSVEVDGVMALVEIEAGPHRITAAGTRDAGDELGVVEGGQATAGVRAPWVMVGRGERWGAARSRRSWPPRWPWASPPAAARAAGARAAASRRSRCRPPPRSRAPSRPTATISRTRRRATRSRGRTS